MSATATIVIVAKRSYGTGSLYLKNGDWYARWRTADGKRHARKLGHARAGGSRDGMSKKDAEALLRGLILEVETTSRAVEHATVQQLGAAHLARLESHGRKPSHLRSTGYHLSVHINPLLGDLNASSLDQSDVRRLIDRMITGGKSPKMIRNVIGTLHGVLGLGVEREILARNPVEGVQLPRVAPTTQIRFLTQDELASVLVARPGEDTTQAERDQWSVTRLLILTAALSGLRLGELRGLRWVDLDFGAMKIRVRHSFVRGELSSPKSRRSIRAVPLATRLYEELEEHHRSTPWNQDLDFVLAHPHTGRPLSETRLREHYAATLERAQVRPVRIHDLRHTFATKVAMSGRVPLRTLQEWMGHESITTTEIYAAYMPGTDEAALLDDALGGQSVANPRPRTTENVSTEAGDVQ